MHMRHVLWVKCMSRSRFCGNTNEYYYYIVVYLFDELHSGVTMLLL